MRRILAAAAATLLLSACGTDDPEPAAAPTTVAPASAAPSPSAAGNSEDDRTCKLVFEATADGTPDALVDTGIVADIVQAAKGASVPDIKAAGPILYDRHQYAITLSGEEGETAAETLLATAMRLRAACEAAGIRDW